MPFTTAQLAAQLDAPALQTWADSTPANQGPLLPAYTAYFAGIQAWINQNGGNGLPFGWNNVFGLIHQNENPVVLAGPVQRSLFNDAFNDVQTRIGQPGFRLFQAAEADRRLISWLLNNP
ncbi:hypothetical protein B0T40_24600 [Chromobacterium haemolyticum]|uniref:hypothetical protein n=1 Tax=Chromobacterium haemolyticum TaxID=394935 RepID=UPI0009DA5700|nr:hypothetical protein [Chromobacterium haemolyticum]OQS30831.1 hypothetical protein B0T40_24600 [Chromobacterium haemolyticum]